MFWSSSEFPVPSAASVPASASSFSRLVGRFAGIRSECELLCAALITLGGFEQVHGIISGIGFERSQTAAVRYAHHAGSVGTELHPGAFNRIQSRCVNDMDLIKSCCGTCICVSALSIGFLLCLGGVLSLSGILAWAASAAGSAASFSSGCAASSLASAAGCCPEFPEPPPHPARSEALRTAANRIEMNFFIGISPFFRLADLVILLQGIIRKTAAQLHAQGALNAAGPRVFFS